MAKHVVARVAELPTGSRKLVTVKGRSIAIFNVGGEFFGLLDRCPHQGGSFGRGLVTGLAVSNRPGEFCLVRKGEIVRCPWHGWEFDIRTGKSWCEPDRVKVRHVPTEIAPGSG